MILLDTVALIRLATGQKMKPTALAAIRTAEAVHEVYVSATSAWELCLLEKSGLSAELIDHDGARFFARLLSETSLKVLPIDGDIATGSRRLPGDFHEDPADRFIIATARHHSLAIVTSDRAIRDYGRAGHVEVIAC